jgi:hypothetical protein
LKISKFLCAASFLNTAAMCHQYEGVVLGNEAGRIYNKIGIMRTLQNFILPIMSLIVTFRSSPLNHKWTICGSTVMTVMAFFHWWSLLRVAVEQSSVLTPIFDLG